MHNGLLEYWADKYGVTLTSLPTNNKQVFKEIRDRPNTKHTFNTRNYSFDIEENYVAKSLDLRFAFTREVRRRYSSIYCSDCKGGTLSLGWDNRRSHSGDRHISGLNLTGTNNYWYRGRNIEDAVFGLTFNCELSDAFMNAWKLENFNAIIEAYQTALNAHNEEVARIEEEQAVNAAAKAEEQKDVMGNFYRIIEGDILKHNCIAYLLQNYLTTLGQDFTDGDKMLNFRVNLGDDLDKYTAKEKFLEQAFEWSIKDYTFYPYFWADRKQWQEMYLSENTDTLFRSFLQAGLARVIVTVKPGFEEAVQYFLETGKVWLGGETPIIGDPLYMSITQEIQEPTGVPQGNYWITRIPTTLTILQAKSAGLEVTQPLPIFPEAEPENCENPEQLETETSFTLDDVQMSSDDRSSTLPSNIVTP